MTLEQYFVANLGIIIILAILTLLAKSNKKPKKRKKSFLLILNDFSKTQFMQILLLDSNDKLYKEFENKIILSGIQNLDMIRFQSLSIISVITVFFGQIFVGLSNIVSFLINRVKLVELAEIMVDEKIAQIPSINILSLVIFSLLSYFIPYIVVRIAGMILSKKSENEVILLQTYALMMLETNKNVRYILETLFQRSKLYKETLRKSIQTYSTDPAVSLDELKNSTDDLSFQSVINSLEKSLYYDREVAISYLKNTRKLEMNMRKINNQKTNKNKQLAGAILLILPLGTLCLVGGYPWLLLVLQMMGQLNAI